MREARVRELCRIARRIADGRDPLGREARARLVDAAGLSSEGVELALSRYLEAEPSGAEVAALVASQAEAPRCHVVLAANVCTAPLRALACAVACAPRVFVKPSRRDPVLAELLAREAAALGIERVEALAAAPGDEAHVYGSDEAIAAIAASLPKGVVVRAHGTGFGIAVVEGDPEAAAAAIAEDLVVFDGRGCLSPRLVLAAEPAAAEPLARALDAALSRSRIPRGVLDPAERQELARYRRTMQAVGAVFEGPHHLVALDPAPEALALPPACRAALVAHLTDVEPWRRYVTAVGGEGPIAAALASRCPGARRAALGAMQKPPFDGPVDRRVNAVFRPPAC